MKRSKDCGCSHDAHERKGNMARKMKAPAKKMAGKKKSIAAKSGGFIQVGGGGKGLG